MKEQSFYWVRGDDNGEVLEFSQVNEFGAETPMDFADCQFDMHIVPRGNGASERIALSTRTGEIVVNGNQVKILLAHHQTEGKTWRQADYDLQLTKPDGIVQTLVYGVIDLHHDITRGGQ